MTIQGAIAELQNLLGADDIPLYYKPAIEKVIETIMDEPERERTDEWCTDCKEYDTEKKCCPRFNRVIREAMKRIPHEDGTLEVKVEDATKVGRVLISDDKHRGGLYYPDEYEPKGEPMKTTDYCDICKRDMCEICVADNANPYCVPSHYEIKQDEPQGDLISRADAIRVVEKNSYRMAGLTEVKLKCEIEALPPADRSRGEWIEMAQDYYETINKKGGGVNENTEYFTDDIACSECLTKFSNIDNETERFNFCPNCGADMRGEDE